MTEDAPSWDLLGKDGRLALIRAVIEADVVPSLQRDGGGVDVVDLVNDCEVHIVYRGACATCPMALYGTLSFIQQILSTKVHPSLLVRPVWPE